MIQVIINDEDDYDVWEDIYELFEFRGNKIVVKWLADEYEIDECEDCGLIRSILRRAWSWYRSKVYIEKKEYQEGVWEDERFLLQQHSNSTDWIVTDKENLITISFKNRRFNETQEIVELEDFPPENAYMLPRILREIADWIAENHYKKAMP